MAKPIPCWGKASKAFVRYEHGRMTEESERIESADPSVFTGKDETRDTPPSKTKNKRNRLPRPSKHEPEISANEAFHLRFGSPPDDLDNDSRRNYFAQFESARKQRQRDCQRRGHHDWRAYRSDWDGGFWHVCADCGAWV